MLDRKERARSRGIPEHKKFLGKKGHCTHVADSFVAPESIFGTCFQGV